MPRWGFFIVVWCHLAVPAFAETYEVGPGHAYATLQDLPDLVAGDLVLVYGNAVYPGNVNFYDEGDGTPDNPIIIRGVPVNGVRPRIHGGSYGIRFDNDYYTFENFEVTGTTSPQLTTRGVFPAAQGIVLRNLLVHDCPRHGILGADGGSGDLLMEYCEVHHCGSGTTYHQVYVATDNALHPQATFRMQYCFIHDGQGGNNVKSRAGRNEIYYNWIEGAFYHELELIGADPAGQTVPPEAVREDSDVVGNVLIKTNTTGLIARVGGDGTGTSDGRYRFVNNTMITVGQFQSVFRYQDVLEAIEYHNNVIFRVAGGPVRVVNNQLSIPIEEVVVSGSNNWLPIGSTDVPPQWIDTIYGTSPGVADAATYDLVPLPASALVDAANPTPQSPPGFEFPNPHFPPARLPPHRMLIEVGSARARPLDGALDVGAYEYAASAVAGDLNCDAAVDGDDVPAFAAALLDSNEYFAAYPACDILLADLTGDLEVDAADVPPFVALLVGG